MIDVKPAPGWVDPFAIFHGNVSTISFADNHAESHTWRDAGVIKAATASLQGKESFYWSGGGTLEQAFLRATSARPATPRAATAQTA